MKFVIWPVWIVCKLVHPKGNQSWIFIERTDVETETPILWPPDAKNWLIWKHPNAGKDWRWEEKGVTEDEMVGWHHWLNGHELSKLWGMAKDREARHPAVHGLQRVRHDWVTDLIWSDVWMWELDSKESWVLKNWCFELWCWRRLLRDPWTARTSNQSILKEISPEFSLEGLIMKLKLQYFGYLMQRADSFEKTLSSHLQKDWRWEEKQTTEDEMVGWHCQLNGHEFE